MLPAHLLWPTIFLTLGFLTLVAEVFIPSGGLIGLAALTFLGLSLWHAFSYSMSLGLTFMLAMAIILPFVASFMVYMWPRTPLGRRMILAPPDEGELDPDSSEEAARLTRLDRLVGEFGKTLTPLRPSGAVEFNNRRLDALAEEGLVPTGKLVRRSRPGFRRRTRSASEPGRHRNHPRPTRAIRPHPGSTHPAPSPFGFQPRLTLRARDARKHETSRGLNRSPSSRFLRPIQGVRSPYQTMMAPRGDSPTPMEPGIPKTTKRDQPRKRN